MRQYTKVYFVLRPFSYFLGFLFPAGSQEPEHKKIPHFEAYLASKFNVYVYISTNFVKLILLVPLTSYPCIMTCKNWYYSAYYAHSKINLERNILHWLKNRAVQSTIWRAKPRREKGCLRATFITFLSIISYESIANMTSKKGDKGRDGKVLNDLFQSIAFTCSKTL